MTHEEKQRAAKLLSVKSGETSDHKLILLAIGEIIHCAPVKSHLLRLIGDELLTRAGYDKIVNEDG